MSLLTTYLDDLRVARDLAFADVTAEAGDPSAKDTVEHIAEILRAVREQGFRDGLRAAAAECDWVTPETSRACSRRIREVLRAT